MADFSTEEGKAANKNGILRAFFVGLALIIQILLIISFFTRLSRYAEWVQNVTEVIALIMVLVIYGQHKTSSMKMPWIILIMAFPVFGIVLYFLIGLDVSTRKMRERYQEIDHVLFPALKDTADPADLEALKKENPAAASIAQYLQNYASYPVYRNTDVEYYEDAAEGLEAQLRDRKSVV